MSMENAEKFKEEPITEKESKKELCKKVTNELAEEQIRLYPEIYNKGGQF